MKKAAAAALLAVLLAALLAGPALAQGTAGIEPVPPHEFAGKVEKATEAVYTTAQPIADALGKVSLAAAGLLAFLVLLSGLSVLKKVIGAVISVGLGLLLFYNAGLIVGVIKGASAWFAGQ